MFSVVTKWAEFGKWPFLVPIRKATLTRMLSDPVIVGIQHIDNSKVSENIEQEKLESNSRNIEEQNKVLKWSNKPERSSRLRTGDLVMKEIKSLSLKKGKTFYATI